jgi:CheY-like chemotaxis protein
METVEAGTLDAAASVAEAARHAGTPIDAIIADGEAFEQLAGLHLPAVIYVSRRRRRQLALRGEAGLLTLTRPVRPTQILPALASALARSDESGVAAEARPGRRAAADGPVRPRAKVLVAEDNLVNQRVAVKMLERLGCQVDVVADGSQAVRRIALVPYDLVLMDCQMPVMDGYEATAAIRRATHVRATVPIVAMTAHALQGDRERCIAAGMNDYISKPVQPSDLKTVIEKYVGAAV